jgi:hypothetical protein
LTNFITKSIIFSLLTIHININIFHINIKCNWMLFYFIIIMHDFIIIISKCFLIFFIFITKSFELFVCHVRSFWFIYFHFLASSFIVFGKLLFIPCYMWFIVWFFMLRFFCKDANWTHFMILLVMLNLILIVFFNILSRFHTLFYL